MSQIRVSNLSFCHAGSFDPVFREVSFVIDTDWRLGFIGRNGRGKTTFLQLLMGRYPYSGSIEAHNLMEGAEFVFRLPLEQEEEKA